jgi:tetratricopeptide (TPR) repeat protein
MKKLAYIFLLLIATAASAQSGKKFVREGNKLYKEKRYRDADSLYREGLKDTASYKAGFNLGDALYKQGKYKEAADYFSGIAQKNKDMNIRAQAYHNMGNCYLESKDYQQSVDAYKNALRINPNDEDTRYNLAYALQKLKKQQQEQQKKDQDKDKDKDKNKDKNKNKDQDKDKDKDKNKDQDKDQNKDQKKNNGQDQPEQQQMTKEQAEQLLNALNNDEKKVQEKLKKKNAKAQRVKVEKDW